MKIFAYCILLFETFSLQFERMSTFNKGTVSITYLNAYSLNSKFCAFIYCQRDPKQRNTFQFCLLLKYLFILTWILQPEVRLRFQVFVVDDVLADMLGEDLVQDVVHRQAQTRLVLQQLLHQEGVKVVRVHHVVPDKDEEDKRYQ